MPDPSFALLNVDKPSGLTSHDVVARIRRQTRIKKIGHAGTLDPMATGVLVICLGKATRLSSYAMGHDKIYEARVTFGIETDTYDAEGTIVSRQPFEATLAQIEALLPRFTGNISQYPPAYSAIKQGGQKLYEKARRGEVIDLPSRSVTIYSIEVLNWEVPHLTLKVHCGAGTYIRSLAHDLGQQIGGGAHLSALRRIASGEHFQVHNAVELATLEAAIMDDTWQQYLLPPAYAVSDYPAVELDAEKVQLLRQGQFISLDRELTGEILCAYDASDELVALLEPREQSLWKPFKVF